MKNTLLALALFAFAGTTAFAHEGETKGGKKGKKKEACAAEAKASCSSAMAASAAPMPSCCSKKGAKTAAVVTPEADKPTVKTL